MAPERALENTVPAGSAPALAGRDRPHRWAAGSDGHAVDESTTACVINFNGAAYLEQSLAALSAQADALAEIVVVDNGSTDGSRALVERRFPKVRLVAMPTNAGAAAARNVALAEAHTDLVLLIDNDVTLGPGVVDALREALAERPDAVLAVPAILHGPAPTGDTVQYDGAETHFLGQQTLQHQEQPYASVPKATRPIGSLVSACAMVHRRRLSSAARCAELTTFDEDFFIYFEDHDFGHRMRMLGLDVLAVPGAYCHHGAGTEGVSIRALGAYSRLRVYCHIRNRWIFLLKNYQVTSLALLSPMLALYEAVQFAAAVKKGWLGEWGRSVWWMGTHLRPLWRTRRTIQHRRRVPDRALLRGGPVPLRDEATRTGMERAARRGLDAATRWYWRMVEGAL